MISRFIATLLFVATSGLAANLPRFAFALPGVNTAAVAVDARGNTYLTGSVDGNAFTATAGAYQPQYAGGTCYVGGGIGPAQPAPCHNSFVIKLDPSGAVVFSTYLGGQDGADGTLIAVDAYENVYVSGIVQGTFPMTPGAFGSSYTPSYYVISWVAKLNSSGTQLAYSTMVPGAYIESIAPDGSGNLYFTGGWNGPVGGLFPATPGAFQTAPLIPTTAANIAETIVGKLNPTGTALVYGTYLSGSLGTSVGTAIAVDASGNAIVTGSTGASDFPSTSGQFTPNSANMFLTKLSADGSALVYSTLLGPASAIAMKTDPTGNIYIVCEASGPAFPPIGTGFGVAPAVPGVTAYLLRIAPDGSTLLASVYLPFQLFPYGGLDVDSAGNAYISGETTTGVPFQMTPGAFQLTGTTDTNQYDTVIAKITAQGQVAGSTFFGGTAGASVISLALAPDGSLALSGATATPDFLGLPPNVTYFAANIFPAITIQNSASFIAGTAVPGALVSLRGYNLGPTTGVSAVPAPGLAGVQVYFDNFVAPITYAQANQINVQAPWELAGQTSTQIRILYNGAPAGSATVPVGAALPGVFFINNSDGSLNTPSNPARAGDFVAVYGTGGGAMSPAGVTGNSWPLIGLSLLTQPVSVTVGVETAQTLYAGSAPTLDSGYFQINVRLPADLTSGLQSLLVKIGGVASAPASISIQ